LVFFDGLPVSESAGEAPVKLNRAFRVTMIWQGAVTVLIAVLGGVTTGGAGFLSAVLGGAIGIAGVLAFALMSMRRPGSSGAAVRTALRAEAVKVVVIVLLLWLALAGYREMVVLPFFGAFMVSVLLSGIAFAVSGD
jgi:ATP synthase protein I